MVAIKHLGENTVVSVEAFLQGHPGHVVADSLVVKDTLNTADSTHGDILVPEPAVGELHDVLLGDLAYRPLDVLGGEKHRRVHSRRVK